MVLKKEEKTEGGMRKRGHGGDEDIDQTTLQGQPNAPRGPISLHTYEHFYHDPYKWYALNLTYLCFSTVRLNYFIFFFHFAQVQILACSL